MDFTGQQFPIDRNMQFRQHTDFYAGAPGDRMSSSAFARSADGPHAYPHISRQNSTHVHGSSSTQLARPDYMGHPHHDLHPLAPPAVHHHRQPSFQHGSPHSWPPYEQGLTMNMESAVQPPYESFPSTSPFPAPQLSPPSTALNAGSYSLPTRPGSLHGSLDPTTGIFYRTPDHPRLRTAQACEKCRARKAKCSGDYPSCKRCINRGLLCEYAKEGRVRGPNKPKPKPTLAPTTQEQTASSRNRSSSTNTSSSTNSSDFFDVPGILTSLRDPRISFPQQNSVASMRSRRGSLSLGEHRSSKPRPPNLQLEPTLNLYQFDPSHNGDVPQAAAPHQSPTRAQAAYRPVMADDPQGYDIYDNSTMPHFQPVYVQVESRSLVQSSYQDRHEQANHDLAQSDSFPQRDSQTMMIQGFESASQYQATMEDNPPVYNAAGYLVHRDSMGSPPAAPTDARFSQEGEYLPIDAHPLHNHPDPRANMAPQNVTSITPTWVELRPPPGISSLSGSFSGPGSSGSSSTATESSFHPSQSEGHIPEHSAHEERMLSMASQPQTAQNMSHSPGASDDPHQGATQMGSSVVGFIGKSMNHLDGRDQSMVYP